MDHFEMAGQSFVQRLPADLARSLSGLGRAIAFKVGQVVSAQGDPGESLFLVSEGVVKILAISPQGDEVLLDFRGPGELLGEYSALLGLRRSGNIVGHQPGVIIKIPARRFRQLALERAEIFLALIGVMGYRLQCSDEQRLAFGSHDVAHRVGATLLRWAQQYGIETAEGMAIGLRASRRELAQAVVASEKTVDDALTYLCRSGMVATGRRKLVVSDPERLGNWVEGRSSS